MDPCVHGPIRSSTTDAGAWITMRPVTFIWTWRVLLATYAATSSAGSSRRRKRCPTERVWLIRSQPEGAPVVALEVEGDEVPAHPPVDEAVGLDPASVADAGVVGVGEPDDLAVAGRREPRPAVAVHPGVRRRSDTHGGPATRRPDPEPLREHLEQLGQGSQRGLLEPVDRIRHWSCSARRRPRRPPRRRAAWPRYGDAAAPARRRGGQSRSPSR